MRRVTGLPMLPRLWAMEPTRFLTLISERVASPLLTIESLSAYWEAHEDEEPPRPYSLRNGVARLDVKGPLVKEDDFWTWWFGGSSLSRIESHLRQAASDEEVTEILLVFDSPGGTLDGTPSVANAIDQVKAIKPVRGHVDGCCCSAAYWLASRCTSLTANPESDISNVGIYTTVTDFSQMLSTEGIEVKLFATGIYKGAGVPGVAMTDAHEEQFRELVSAPFRLFQEAVKTGRNLTTKVLTEISEGKVYMAGDVVSMGLVDRVGYMTDGVPPSLEESPETTSDGTPPAPPSENEEQAHMDSLNALKKLLGLPVEETQQATTGAGAPSVVENRGSQPVEAEAFQARITALEATVQSLSASNAAQQARIQSLLEANNLLMMDTYVRRGLVTPANRESQARIRMGNPEAYDEAMAACLPSVAFGGGVQSKPDGDTIPATQALQLVGGLEGQESNKYAAVVAQFDEKLKAEAEKPNILQKTYRRGA